MYGIYDPGLLERIFKNLTGRIGIGVWVKSLLPYTLYVLGMSAATAAIMHTEDSVDSDWDPDFFVPHSVSSDSSVEIPLCGRCMLTRTRVTSAQWCTWRNTATKQMCPGGTELCSTYEQWRRERTECDDRCPGRREFNSTYKLWRRERRECDDT